MMREPDLELVYLMAAGFGMRLFMPLRGEASVTGEAGRPIEGDDAYAMIKYWPEHELFEEENAETVGPGETRWFQVRRLDPKVAANPIIRFAVRASWEDAERMVPVLEQHFREWMKPETLDGADLYCRMSRIVQNRLAWEEMQRERQERHEEATEEKARRNRKKAAFSDPQSKFYQAELSIRHGERFETTITLGNKYPSHKRRKSSAESALRLLRDPKTAVVYIEEAPSDGLVKEGYVMVEVGLDSAARRPGEATTFLNYSAPPIATLIERGER